jgi:predicted AAA+ superfamily ATPase
MLDEFQRHNLFWDDLSRYENEDPHLSLLSTLPLVHPMNWWREIDWERPGIFILTGGRQIGKSTSTKLLIKELLLQKRFDRRSIFYLPCDQIVDRQHLMRILRFFIDGLTRPKSSFLLIIDEVTFVPEWDRTIKALADEGWFRQGFCLLTGSDSAILKEATVRFPGRRGEADIVDFHLWPLSFRDYAHLTQPRLLDHAQEKISDLFNLFSNYLSCGGYLRAINDLHQKGRVTPATYATFEQWIRGDFIKRGRTEANLLSVLKALVETGVSQTSYSRLSERADLLSKETFMEYCQLLERMDILFNLQAFDQSRRRGFPKKARKFHFSDPFIHDTIESWLLREHLITEKSPEGFKVEATVAAQYHRHSPVYYLKAEGEIDLLIPLKKGFLPIEVKWSEQMRAKDLAQLRKYGNSVILTKGNQKGTVDGVRACPLPLFLIEDETPQNPGTFPAFL